MLQLDFRHDRGLNQEKFKFTSLSLSSTILRLSLFLWERRVNLRCCWRWLPTGLVAITNQWIAIRLRASSSDFDFWRYSFSPSLICFSVECYEGLFFVFEGVLVFLWIFALKMWFIHGSDLMVGFFFINSVQFRIFRMHLCKFKVR